MRKVVYTTFHYNDCGLYKSTDYYSNYWAISTLADSSHNIAFSSSNSTYQVEGVAAGDSTALEGVEHDPEEVVPDSEEVELDYEEAELESAVEVAWLEVALAGGIVEH